MTKEEDFFKENFPEYVTEKGEFLTPYWDLFNAGVICDTFECKVKIEQLEKENAELKEENKKSNVLFADIIEAFTSCSYNDDFEMTQAGKEIYELFYGGKDPKEVFHNAEVSKCSRQLLAEAKDLIKTFVNECKMCRAYPEAEKMWDKEIAQAEQFLKECE